jgi:hypothetical protein
MCDLAFDFGAMADIEKELVDILQVTQKSTDLIGTVLKETVGRYVIYVHCTDDLG